MEYPCESSSERTIVIVDDNVFIYSKRVFREKKEQIEEFWDNFCGEYCVCAIKEVFETKIYEKEKNKEFLAFLNILLEKQKFLLCSVPPIVKLSFQEKQAIDAMRSRKQNDAEGLAKVLKFYFHLEKLGKEVTIFTYDFRAIRRIKSIDSSVKFENSFAHKLYRITQLPPTFPQHQSLLGS